MKLRSFFSIVAALVLLLASHGEAFAQDYRPTPEQQKTWREFMETNPEKYDLHNLVCTTPIEEPFKIMALGELLRVPLEKWEGIQLLSCNPPEPYAGLLFGRIRHEELSVEDLVGILNSQAKTEYKDRADQELKSRNLETSELAYIVFSTDGNHWSWQYAAAYWEKLLRYRPTKGDLLEITYGAGEHAGAAVSELVKHYPLTNTERRGLVNVRSALVEDRLLLAWELLSVNPSTEDLASVAYSGLEPYNTIATELLLASDPATKRDMIRRSMYK